MSEILDLTVPFNEGIKTKEQKEKEGNLSGGVALIYPTDNKCHLLSSPFGKFVPIAKHATPGNSPNAPP
jgi:hypothetical protein